MKRLIINADDFGFNKEITDGIIQAHEAGTVTSTTLMVNMPAAEYAAELAKKHPDLSVGIHLNLTLGTPLSRPEDIPSLITPEGKFKGASEMFKLANRFLLSSKEIEKELSLQIEKFLSFGIKPTHADSHHHVADALQIHLVKVKLFKRYNITKTRTQRGFYRSDKFAKNKLRAYAKTLKTNIARLPYRLYYEFIHLHYKIHNIKTPDERYGLSKLISDRELKLSIEDFEVLFASMPERTVELCTHPGLPHNDPTDRAEFQRIRLMEYNILTDRRFLELIQKYNIKLINFNDL